MRPQCTSGPATPHAGRLGGSAPEPDVRADVIVLRLSITPNPPEETPRLRLWAALAAVSTLIVIVLVIVFAAPSASPSRARVPPIRPDGGPETMFTAGSTATDTPPRSTCSSALGSTASTSICTGRTSHPTRRRRQSRRLMPATRRPIRRRAGFSMTRSCGRWPPGTWGSCSTSSRRRPTGPPARAHPTPRASPSGAASAAEFGQFVRAVATRYSGHYTPPGAPKPLPRVNFWSIWNEPNLGIEMAPEAIDHSQVEVSAHYYRDFVDAAWKAFGRPATATTRSCSARSRRRGSFTGVGPGDFNAMPPLRYLRAHVLRRLQLQAAAAVQAATSATARRRRRLGTLRRRSSGAVPRLRASPTIPIPRAWRPTS